MITVTEAAGAYLNNLLEEVRAPGEAAIRMVVQGKDVSLRLDSERPGDASVDHKGRTILVLDNGASSALASKKLDVKTTEEGPKLTVT